MTGDQILLALYDHLVEPATSAPTFYTGFPASCSPLAAADPAQPRHAQKWDLVIGGREIATAYTELTDSAQLRRRLAADSAEADTVSPAPAEVFDLGLLPRAGSARR